MARPRTVSDDAILAATANAVAASGPANVTLAQIGAAVGLTAAALLRRFGSKDRLLLALARHGAETVPARLAAAAQADHPVPALIEMFTAMAASVRGPAEFANHMAFLLMDLSVPEFQQVAREYTAGVEAAIATVLKAAGLPADDDLPRAIHAAYNGALITWGMSGADADPAEQVRAQLLRLLPTTNTLSATNHLRTAANHPTTADSHSAGHLPASSNSLPTADHLPTADNLPTAGQLPGRGR